MYLKNPLTIVNGVAKTIVTTKGDLLAATGPSTISRLGVGGDNYVLTADSSEATGMKWAALPIGFADPMTTDGDLIARIAGATTRIGIGSVAQVLTVSGGIPSWQNAASGFADPMSTRGDLIFRNSSGVTARLGVGSANQVLQTDGTDTSWQTLTASDITDFASVVAANAAVAANTSKITNATHTGEVTGSGVLTITNDAVTYAKMQNVISDQVLLGNIVGAGGAVAELTAAQVRTLINVADGATAVVVSDVAYNAISWDSNTDAATKNAIRDKFVVNDAAIGLNTAKVTNATHSGDVTGATVLTIAADAVTYLKMQNVVVHERFLGNNSGGGSPVEELSMITARAMLNIADGATANSSDATLLDRANHTGTQVAATISDFDAEVANNASVVANTAKVTNATHTGEVTGSGVLTVANGAITYAKIQNMSSARILGRSTAFAGDVEELTAGQVRTLIGVTISDIAYDATSWDTNTDAASKNAIRDKFVVNDAAIGLNTAKVTNATHTGDVTGATVLTIAPGAVDIAMLSAAGVAGVTTYLRGDNTWATVSGGGDVSKVGIPVNDQVGVWTGSGTLEGDANLTFDGSNLTVGGNVNGIDIATDVPLNTAKVTNATHTGDVTGAGALTIAADAVTYAKIQNVVADNRILGNVSGAGSIVAELTAAQVRTMINVSDGATAVVVSDVAYDAKSWDANPDAATKNAIRDKFFENDAAIALNTAKLTNATHTGDVTGATVLTIAADAVTYPKMQNVVVHERFLGNNSGGGSPVEELSMITARGMLNVADGATANSADATLLDRANHTGTQLAATISDLSAALASSGAIMETFVNAKGDLIVATANDTPSIVGVGTNNHVLTADSTQASGVKWAANPAGFADPMTSRGDLVFKNPSGVTTRLGVGSANQVLQTDGSDTSWQTLTASDVTDFQAAVAANAAVALNTAKITNATHSGDVTGATVLTIAADAVTYLKMQNVVANDQFLGNNSGGGSPVEELSMITARGMLNVEDGATANSSDAALLNRANHTGLQLAATISDFATSVASTIQVAANTSKVTNSTHTGDVTGATVLTIAPGAVDIAMLSATGTASVSTYLRGDNTWATVVGTDVSKVGTPVNDQVGVWTGDGTIEGDANLTFDGSNLSVGGNVNGIDIATDVPLNTAKVTNSTHTGDVTGSGALTIANDAVTYAKIQNVVADQRILGNVAGAGQPVAELTAAQVRTLINVEDGATANSSDATLLARGNHIGTQTASTISDFASAVASAGAILDTIVDAKGDLLVGVANDTIARLGVGANDNILTADSTQASGLKWAASPAGFSDPMTTRGDLIFKDSGGNTTRIGVGSANQVLQTDGTDTSWQSLTASDVTDFQAVVSANAAVALNTAKLTNATHSGDVTGAGALTIAADAVTYAKIQNVVADSVLLGNIAGAGGVVAEITTTQIRTLINVADGATANSSDVTLLARANHTGTQLIGTISDFNIGSLVDNNIFQYDSVTSKWINAENNIKTVYVDGINTPTDRTLETVFAMAGTPGHLSGAAITKNGDGTIDISEGEFLVHLTNDIDSPLHVIKCPAYSSLALTDGAPNTVFVNPTGPTYAVIPATVGYFEAHWDHAPFALATRVGNIVHVLDARANSKSYGYRRSLREAATGNMTYGGGMAVADEGSLEFSVTAGIAYVSNLTLYETDAFDTSVASTFTSIYRGVTGWTRVTSQTSLDNGYYDDGTGTLHVLTAGKYTIHWIYVVGDDTDVLYTSYGQGDYTLLEAQEAGIPSSVPPELSVYSSAILVAKVIIEQGVATFEEIQDPNATVFQSKPVNVHNDLGGLQGGVGGEYYHLTSAQKTDLTDSGDATIHYHATDRARANHTGTQAASTISDFDVEVANNSAVSLNTAKITNATHTGEVTGATALTITDDAVTYAKIQNVALDQRILGNVAGAGSSVAEMTAGQVRTMINVADGATVNSSDAFLLARANHTGVQLATTVEMAEIGAATYDDVQDWSNSTQSAGVIDGGVLTDGGIGTLDISAVKGVVKTTDSAIGDNVFFDLALSAGVALTDNSTNYIAVDYNSGTPQFIVSTSNAANGHTIFNLGKVYREGTGLDIVDSGLNIYDFNKRVQQHHLEESALHFVSGAIVTATGTRNIALTIGVMYAGLNRIPTTAIDTSGTDDFKYYYYTGAAWVESDQTQIDNLNYNDIASGLDTLSNNKYGVHWVYKGTGVSTYVVYGQSSYTLADAQAAQPPGSLPDHVNEFGVLRAKIIIKKSATAFTEIESVDDITFTSFTPSDHNELTSLQGGLATEYYHLTSAQHTDLTDAGDSALHYHSIDRARANHTGTQVAATISDFDVEVANNSAVSLNTAKVTNATHTGDVTGATALTIAADSVTYAKMQNVAGNNVVLGNNSGAGGIVEELSAAEIRSLINVEDGATANSSDATLLARSNHTGTQTVSTISDFDTEVANNSAVSLNTAKVTNATHTGDVTGATALTIAANSVTYAKMQSMTTARMLGRVTSGIGNVEELTAAQIRSLINVADGATAVVISDVAYDATSWDANTDAATKNAIRDKFFINDAAITLNTSKLTNANHSGDVTGATALTIAADAVTYAKMQNVVGNNVVLGNNSGAGGIVDELTATELRSLINVEDGSTANSSDATLLARSNHTGTQTVSTISDFDTEVAGNTAVGLNTAKVTNATHTGDVTGDVALTIADNAVDLAMLSATGTALVSTYLRGDNTWATIAAGGDVTAAAVIADNALVRGDGGAKGVQDSDITIDDTEHILGVKTLGYATAYANGLAGAALSITLTNGQHQTVTLDNAATALTIVDTGNVSDGTWRITCTQHTGGSFGITSATVSGGTVKTAGGTALTFTAAAGSVDLMVIVKEGTNYYLQLSAKDMKAWT